MKTASFSDIISLSLERTKLLLFTRFSFKRWVKLVFIAYLAGTLSSGAGINVGDWASGRSSQEVEEAEGKYDGPASEGFASTIKDMREMFSDPVAIWIAAGLGVLMCLVILVFMWLSMRFRFIFYNVVVANSDAIGEPFRRYKKQGNSLFGFYATVFGISLVMYAGFGWWAWSIWQFLEATAGTDPDVWRIVQAYAAPAVVFALISSVWMVVWHWLINLMVPMMAMDGAGFRDTLPKFITLYRSRMKDFWLFLLVSLGLGIVSSILGSIVFVAILFAFLLMGAIVFGLLYLVFMVMLESSLIFAIFAAIVGLPFMMALMAVMLAVLLPFAVFFQAFYVYFLTSLDAGYAPLPIALAPSTAVESVTPNPDDVIVKTSPEAPKNNVLLVGCLIGCVTIPVVLFLIGLVAAIVIPNLLRAKVASNTAITEINVQAMADGVEMYAREHGVYPTDAEQLLRGDPPYWTGSLCGEVVGGYTYRCIFSLESYRIEAQPVEEGEGGTGVIRRVSQPGGLNVDYREEYL